MDNLYEDIIFKIVRGKISKKYNYWEKSCECGYKIDRDINGSRNILMKNIKVLTTEGLDTTR